jgi:hypothetical protein
LDGKIARNAKQRLGRVLLFMKEAYNFKRFKTLKDVVVSKLKDNDIEERDVIESYQSCYQKEIEIVLQFKIKNRFVGIFYQ